MRARLLTVVFTAAVWLAGGFAPAAAQATRVIVDDLGFEVEIPVDPQRIVALRGDQITAPLIELGANLVGAGGIVSPNVNGGQPYVWGAYDVLDFRFEDSGVAFVGLDNDFDIEAVAAARPDLIFVGHNQAARRDQLMAIAPTVVINFASSPENTTFVRYQRIAELAGMCGEVTCLDRFLSLQRGFLDRLERYRGIVQRYLGDPSEVTLSYFGFNDGTTLTVFRHLYLLTEMIDALGFSYPPFILAMTESSLVISAEQLPELNADFLVTFTRPLAGTSSPADNRQQLEAAFPGWQDFLHAPAHGQWLFVDLDQSRPVTFAAARYTLDWLMANIVFREFVPLEN